MAVNLARQIEQRLGITRSTGGGRSAARKANQRIATAMRRKSRGGKGG